MMRGKFITLEGVDGAGKSSHVDWIANYLRKRGFETVVTREPGGTEVGEKLRRLVLGEPMSIETETLLVFAARQEHLCKVIRPALDAGSWVVSDRFTDATYAYQGGGRGLASAKIETLEAWVQDGLTPDLTLVFDVPLEIARSRLAASQAEWDRFEREGDDFFRRVRTAYHERASKELGRVRLVDSSRSLSDIRVELENILSTI
jgi:dTMP kinase